MQTCHKKLPKITSYFFKHKHIFHIFTFLQTQQAAGEPSEGAQAKQIDCRRDAQRRQLDHHAVTGQDGRVAAVPRRLRHRQGQAATRDRVRGPRRRLVSQRESAHEPRGAQQPARARWRHCQHQPMPRHQIRQVGNHLAH